MIESECKSGIKSFLGAQLVSLLIASTGVVNTILMNNHNFNIPTSRAYITLHHIMSIFFFSYRILYQREAQSAFNYMTLCVVFVPIWMNIVGLSSIGIVLRRKWWIYLLIAFADVEANYLIVKAYSLTLVTTIQVCKRAS